MFNLFLLFNVGFFEHLDCIDMSVIFFLDKNYFRVRSLAYYFDKIEIFNRNLLVLSWWVFEQLSHLFLFILIFKVLLFVVLILILHVLIILRYLWVLILTILLIHFLNIIFDFYKKR